jgi:hypothetical protein
MVLLPLGDICLTLQFFSVSVAQKAIDHPDSLLLTVLYTANGYLIFNAIANPILGFYGVKKCNKKVHVTSIILMMINLILMIIVLSYLAVSQIDRISKKNVGAIIVGKIVYEILGLIVSNQLIKDMSAGLQDIIHLDAKVGPQERLMVLD